MLPLRSYLLAHIDLSRSPPFPLASFSFLVLPLPPAALPVTLLLFSFVLTLFLLSTLLLRFISTRFPVTFPPHRCRARYILPLFSLLAGRTFCFSLKVTRPPARCFLECQIAVRLYPRNRHRGFVPLRAFDRTPDSTAMMRENHKRLLLSRCTISILMDIKPFSFAVFRFAMERYTDFNAIEHLLFIILYRSYIVMIFIIGYRNGLLLYKYNNKPYKSNLIMKFIYKSMRLMIM